MTEKQFQALATLFNEFGKEVFYTLPEDIVSAYYAALYSLDANGYRKELP